MLFKKRLDESNCKGNKIWLDKASEFYKRSRSMKSWLQDNNIEIFSIYKRRKIRCL